MFQILLEIIDVHKRNHLTDYQRFRVLICHQDVHPKTLDYLRADEALRVLKLPAHGEFYSPNLHSDQQIFQP